MDDIYLALEHVMGFRGEQFSLPMIIRSQKPYLYNWRSDGGVDIVKVGRDSRPHSLQLWRYSGEEIGKTVDIDDDPPSLEDLEALKALQRTSYLTNGHNR